MPKTSHKKNRPFDFKLIDLVEGYPVLYQRQKGLSTYETMKRKNEIWKIIAEEIGSPIDFCIMRWSNLRGQFQKELRNCRELCPKQGVIRGSNWPYLERMRFLEGTVQFNKQKVVREKKRKIKDEDEQYDIVETSEFCRTEDEDILHDFEENIDEDDDDDDEYSLIEEIPEEHADGETFELVSYGNLQKMTTYLEGIDSENKVRVERRIMAFLCKCQLRALVNGGVDDLYI